MIKEYQQRPAYLPCFDSVFSEIKSVFSQEKEVYYELYRLESKVVFFHDENKIKKLI